MRALKRVEKNSATEAGREASQKGEALTGEETPDRLPPSLSPGGPVISLNNPTSNSGVPPRGVDRRGAFPATPSPPLRKGKLIERAGVCSFLLILRWRGSP